MKNLYGLEEVERFIAEKLDPLGYEVYAVSGGLLDNLFCYAPDDKHYNFIFKEEYLNSWSSAYSMRRCMKMPKWAEKMIDDYMDEQDEAFEREKREIA